MDLKRSPIDSRPSVRLWSPSRPTFEGVPGVTGGRRGWKEAGSSGRARAWPGREAPRSGADRLRGGGGPGARSAPTEPVGVVDLTARVEAFLAAGGPRGRLGQRADPAHDDRDLRQRERAAAPRRPPGPARAARAARGGLRPRRAAPAPRGAARRAAQRPRPREGPAAAHGGDPERRRTAACSSGAGSACSSSSSTARASARCRCSRWGRGGGEGQADPARAHRGDEPASSGPIKYSLFPPARPRHARRLPASGRRGPHPGRARRGPRPRRRARPRRDRGLRHLGPARLRDRRPLPRARAPTSCSAGCT